MDPSVRMYYFSRVYTYFENIKLSLSLQQCIIQKDVKQLQNAQIYRYDKNVLQLQHTKQVQ